ncbi:hypothetical protein [Gloeocapsa sp. PCC 7428]|uniref:hypothetical protein n=1 Tax=Gloeocapsa sp. PCC 7428 TaxID=1173026 RepID=UPI0030D8A6C5
MREVGCVRRCPPLSKPTVSFPPLRSHSRAGVPPVERSGVQLAWAEEAEESK